MVVSPYMPWPSHRMTWENNLQGGWDAIHAKDPLCWTPHMTKLTCIGKWHIQLNYISPLTIIISRHRGIPCSMSSSPWTQTCSIHWQYSLHCEIHHKWIFASVSQQVWFPFACVVWYQHFHHHQQYTPTAKTQMPHTQHKQKKFGVNKHFYTILVDYPSPYWY